MSPIYKNQTEGLLQVIYAGDSAADELAMEVLRGVAYSFKVNCLRDLSGLYWSPLASIGLYWSLLVSIGLYWSLLVSIDLYWSLYQVINEDTSALTKTWANARLEGPDAVQTMLK